MYYYYYYYYQNILRGLYIQSSDVMYVKMFVFEQYGSWITLAQTSRTAVPYYSAPRKCSFIL